MPVDASQTIVLRELRDDGPMESSDLPRDLALTMLDMAGDGDLVESWWKPDGCGCCGRQMYGITDEGIAALNRHADEN